MAAPASPSPLTMERVRAAQSLLRQIVPESRLAGTDKLSSHGGGWVYLKLESEGPTGSFKVRGAYHAIDVRQKQMNGKLPGVVTSSTGNHGAAVAYAAAKRHIPSRVYLPENPNPAKRARIADIGAEIVEAGKIPGGNQAPRCKIRGGIQLVQHRGWLRSRHAAGHRDHRLRNPG